MRQKKKEPERKGKKERNEIQQKNGGEKRGQPEGRDLNIRGIITEMCGSGEVCTGDEVRARTG